MAHLEYREHRISVTFDTPNQFQFTPVVRIRLGDSAEVLTTILAHKAFVTKEIGIEFGFILGREWIDEHLSESQRDEASPRVRLDWLDIVVPGILCIAVGSGVSVAIYLLIKLIWA